MTPKEAKELEEPKKALLTITLRRGLVGKRDTHRRVITALGLGKYGSSSVHADTPSIRGMIHKVQHLVTVGRESTALRAQKHLSRQSRRQAETKNG